MNSHNKSLVTIIFDVIRNILILIATIYVLSLLWQWHWLSAVVGAIPIYVLIMNIIGFLTLPVYLLTPENRLLKKTSDAFDNNDFEAAKELNKSFEDKFKTRSSEDNKTY